MGMIRVAASRDTYLERGASEFCYLCIQAVRCIDGSPVSGTGDGGCGDPRSTRREEGIDLIEFAAGQDSPPQAGGIPEVDDGNIGLAFFAVRELPGAFDSVLCGESAEGLSLASLRARGRVDP